MNKTIIAVIVFAIVAMSPVLCTGQESISDDSLQASSEDSLQNSSEDSLQNSSEESSRSSTEESSQNSTEESYQNTTDNSFQYSTDQTTGASSDGSSQESTDGTAQLEDASAVTLLVGGAVVAVGLTAVGIIYLVNVNNATQEDVVGLQDQIYAAQGPDYQRVLDELGIVEKDLVHANDQIVADGFMIECDQDAADYLVALMLKLGEQMPAAKLKANISLGPGLLPAA
jgi:hypothetical protein